jgi:hypothetical protein
VRLRASVAAAKIELNIQDRMSNRTLQHQYRSLRPI